MREYEPVDDGLEPSDFDGYYDVPAQKAKDVAFRFYIKVERDPKRAALFRKRQNEAILKILQWMHANRAELAAKGLIPPESDAP